MTHESDLLIVGGGPAGLSAAINAASEGLKTTILEGSSQLGGQAKESNAIENFLGFPDGVTGEVLMRGAIKQAIKFDTSIVCPASAALLRRDGDRLIITSQDEEEFVGKAVILANGLNYRRLGADGLGSVMSRGAHYGMPAGQYSISKRCEVAVVGGANSAGQAVLKLAQNKNASIKMIVRSTLEKGMSEYLVERIRSAPNIEVCEGCEVTRVDGGSHLEQIVVKSADGSCTEMKMDHLFIFIGAQPRTLWLRGVVQLDEKKYISTDGDVDLRHRADGDWPTPLPYETSVPGVFAAGDIRLGSTKRVSVAIGEGAAALQMVHRHLARLE